MIVKINKIKNSFLNKFNKQYLIKKTKSNGIFKTGLCAIMEILLRHMDKHKKDGKKWFFSKEEAIVNNLISIKK